MADLKHDIERYLNGEMSPAEMHSLEKKALDDPFLADALEGGSLLPMADFSSDVGELKDRIRERIEGKRKIIPFWYWSSRIAAGLLIVGLATYLVVTFSGETSTNKQLALNDEKEKVVITPDPAAKEPAKPAFEEAATEQVDALAKSDQSTTAKRSHRVQKPEEQIASYKESVSSGDVASAPVLTEAASDAVELDDNADNKEDEIVVIPQVLEGYVSNSANVSDKRKSEVTEFKKSAAPINGRVAGMEIKPRRTIRGKVTDADDGSALPGVNVVVKGSDKGTVTNVEGAYELTLTDTTHKELEFSFVGMQMQDVAVSNADSVNVKLSPDYASLSEVVVVGYGSREDGVERKEENNYEVASPEGGRKEFRTYLTTKLQYPPLAVENKIEGKVTVQFFVDTSGVLSDFRILKGIGYGCDQEALRLIKQGPKWSATKRNDVPLRSKVKVKVKFKLPK